MLTFALARGDGDCCRGDDCCLEEWTSGIFFVRFGVVGKKARCFLPGDVGDPPDSDAVLLGVFPALLLTTPPTRCFVPGDPSAGDAMLLGVFPALLLTTPPDLRRENASL